MEEIYLREEVGRLGVFVPLDHPMVVQPRSQDFIYSKVLEKLQRDTDFCAEFLDLLAPFISEASFESVSQDKESETAPYWQNGYFSGDDARIAYAYVASGLPRRIIEVGSGNSTKFMRKAIDDYGRATQITSIDPEPRAEISSIVDRVIRSSVLDVDLSVFEELAAGDVLFWDGSHLVFNGTDTVRLFLEVLPILKPGVLVHIHDICLPGEYITSFDGRGYSEQYMLATALLFSNDWEVVAPVHHLCSTGRLLHGGVSFWMRRGRAG